MAKKQKTALEETQELAEKLLADEIKDITLPEEEEKVEEPEKTEVEVEAEKKKEEVVETPKEEPKAIDEDELTEKISKAVSDKVLKQMTGEDEKKKGDADQELVSPWTKEGRNPKDYDEIADWAMTKNEILSTRKAEESERQRQEQETQQKQVQEEQDKTQKQIQEEQAKAFNQVIDDELDELYTNNKLPRIKNKDDAKDPGVIARKHLFQTMLDINNQRKEEGKPAIMSVSRIFHTYYKPPTTQPAGADAPISLGQGMAEAADPEDFSYADLQKEQKGWGWFRRR